MVGDKRKRPMKELTPENRHATEPSGLMAASWGATKEEEGHQHKRRESIDSFKQQASEGGVAADADVTTAIGHLSSYP